MSVGRHRDRLVGDILVPVAVAERLNAQRVLLVSPCKRDDRPRHGCREEQGPPLLRRRVEDLLELLAKAHVEHLVCLVEHRHAQRRQVERAAFQVVAEPSGCADDDMRAACKRAPLLHRVHAADAGDDPTPGIGVKPLELAADLDRKLAGRRNDQSQRLTRERHPARFEQLLSHGHAECDRFPRARLSRDDQVSPVGIFSNGPPIGPGSAAHSPVRQALRRAPHEVRMLHGGSLAARGCVSHPRVIAALLICVSAASVRCPSSATPASRPGH